MSNQEVKVALRWSDQDVLGHVNNVTMLRLLEEARIRFMGRRIRPVDAPSVTMFVAHQEIDYATPLMYTQEDITVRVWVTRIGTSGFDLGCELLSAERVTCAIAETSLVVVDGAGRPSPIPAEIRAALVEMSGDPVPFRRRRASV